MVLTKTKLSTTLIMGGSRAHTLRQLFTTVKPSRECKRRDLYDKLSKIWSTGENVSDVLDKFSQNYHRNLKPSDLTHCIKVFRNYGRYHHCLQILEWMEKNITDYKDHALRLNLIYKTKGLAEAEKYYESLPVDAMKKPIYGTLFNCYCTEKMIEKALALFEKMDEMQYASDDMTFTNLMCLYMKVDQPEKVPPLIEEMKRREIPLSSVSYQTWMQSYGCLNDLESVERVLDEIQKHKLIKDDWRVYSGSASVFIKAGKGEKVIPLLKKLEEFVYKSDNPDRVAYHFLISLYAGVGDSESVIRVWDKFKSKFKVCHNLSYLIMLQALSKLGNLDHLKACFEEWNTRYKSYDVRLPTCVAGAYLRHDMFDDATLLLSDATDRSGKYLWAMHVCFMDYFLDKCQMNSALKHLELALGNNWPWKPHAEKLYKFFEYFIEAKDVEGAERLCQMLEKDQPFPSIIYVGLLQTYAAAGRTAPELRGRMTQIGTHIGAEHKELLDKVCPN